MSTQLTTCGAPVRWRREGGGVGTAEDGMFGNGPRSLELNTSKVVVRREEEC